MIAKIVMLIANGDKDTLAKVRTMGTLVTHSATAEHSIAMLEPRYYHTRREVSAVAGVVLLPGMHDPAPIRDLHKHLSHVEAKPEHTMREVALRLSDVHGPSFDPDT